jgi:hypothetical protein
MVPYNHCLALQSGNPDGEIVAEGELLVHADALTNSLGLSGFASAPTAAVYRHSGPHPGTIERA